ncbi:ABC transporter permease [Xanthocytophaga agilis]|uniref:ABC transporter permease n=1 Tax=Xanthocytophaga agilis TaxID=3048010 RepID=A0AAE3UIH7_9BACT|nr:ABC transporter permease [Xanthocytophaga agilis]MDJ1504482.1 ABC transporter permease [Xanthocytophaga agilis]
MNLTENIKEGLRSIQGNLLRTILTALIITIGITALVGILTAIEGIRAQVDSSFSSLGANSFTLEGTRWWRRQNAGRNEKIYPPLEYREAKKFMEEYTFSPTVTVNTMVSGNVEAKYLSKKTNPNSRLMGGNNQYIAIKGYKLSSGREFSNPEMKYAGLVAIIGSEVQSTLFDKVDPLGKEVVVKGLRFKVIGVLEKAGGMFGGGGADRTILVPLETARKVPTSFDLTYDITVSVPKVEDLDEAIGEATGLMRAIRHDRPGQPESFEIESSGSLREELDGITGALKIGGGVIGFVTLLGAAICLMNIMMVSVTERTREIGIRKALGATPLRIRQQFLIEAIVICQLGGIAGVLLGILVGNGMSSLLGANNFVVPWFWMILGLIVCVTVGLIAGYYPAYRASKLDPIESLRYE